MKLNSKEKQYLSVKLKHYIFLTISLLLISLIFCVLGHLPPHEFTTLKGVLSAIFFWIFYCIVFIPFIYFSDKSKARAQYQREYKEKINNEQWSTYYNNMITKMQIRMDISNEEAQTLLDEIINKYEIYR